MQRNGKPLELKGCEIIVESVDGRIALAEVLQEDGSFRIGNAQAYGLPPGKYRISLGFPKGYVQGLVEGNKPNVEQTLERLIPNKYRKPETSGLDFDLTTEGYRLDLDMRE